MARAKGVKGLALMGQMGMDGGQDDFRKWTMEDLNVANMGRKELQKLLPAAIETTKEIIFGDNAPEASGWNGNLTKNDARLQGSRLKACELVFKYCLPDLNLLGKDLLNSGGLVENVDKKIQLNIMSDPEVSFYNKDISEIE